MVRVSPNIATMFSPPINANQWPNSKINPQAARTPEMEAALKSKNAERLTNLHRSFFETAANAKGVSPQTAQAVLPFPILHPRDAMLLGQALKSQTYHVPLSDIEGRNGSPNIDETSPDHRRNQEKAASETTPTYQNPNFKYTPLPRHPPAKTGLAAGQGPAAEGIAQIQNQTQNFIANMLGPAYASGNMVDFLGPHACFEDVLMSVMMKIAKDEEKNIATKIRNIERGSAGLPGFFSDRARDLGGIAGGALGGFVGGLPGAAVGQDIGERLVGSYTGYNNQESRQIQFEKLKHMMNKQSEMMSCISNILASMHQTNKNTISNIKG